MAETFDRDRLVEMVRGASTGVFQTMLGMDLRSLDAYVEADPPAATAGILSLIGLAGSWVGTGSMYCSTAMAVQIADTMLMSPHQAVDEEVMDAMAEMANMILGNVKTELEELFGPMMMSIPTVLFGRNFIKRSLGHREWIVIPFECGTERIEIQICLMPNSDPHSAAHSQVRPYGVHV